MLNFERDVSDITSRDVIEMMMITQYFDMLKDIGVSNRNSTVFLPHSPANVADVAGQIRAGFMQVNTLTHCHKLKFLACCRVALPDQHIFLKTFSGYMYV